MYIIHSCELKQSSYMCVLVKDFQFYWHLNWTANISNVSIINLLRYWTLN